MSFCKSSGLRNSYWSVEFDGKTPREPFVKKKRRGTKRASRQTAAVKSTGGGGYSFADEVAAHFLIELLRGGTPLGSSAGPITQVHFEVSESGWILDDLLLIATSQSGMTRCAVSIKSNGRLSASGLDKEFASDAWRQWNGLTGSDFNRERDYLGLATIPSGNSVERNWNELVAEARGTQPERFGLRVKGNGPLSAAKIRMFESLRRRHVGTTVGKPTRSDTAGLLARLFVFQFDFQVVLSADRESDVGSCREIVRSGTLADAKVLREQLIVFAAEARTTGGYFDVPRLVRRLQGAVDLKDFQDHRNDWESLDRRAQRNMEEIGTVVGENIHIERVEEVALLKKALSLPGCMAVIGESGSGKSAAVVTVLRGESIFRHVLWLNAQELSRASQADLSRVLGLQYDLHDLVQTSAARSLLVLDGFEQLGGEGRARALELVRMAQQTNGRWTILITMQPDEYVVVRRALLDAGVEKVEAIAFASPKPAQVFEKIHNLPGVASLFVRRELQPILCNLATLHWVIQTERVRSLVSSRPWIGETELIEWIWSQWLGESATKHVRGLVLRRLGESEGERISGAVPIDAINIQELSVLGELEKQGIVRFNESAVKFSHDLSGDWARLQSLIVSGSDGATRIRERAGVPRWSRAIRLYAQRLIEREEGLAGWKTFVAGFSAENPEEKLASDLFLDGIVFATNVESLLEHIWSELIADEGAILRRLLLRIMHVATVPDWRYQGEVGAEDADLIAAWFRIPNPLYWVPVLRTLARHSEDVTKAGIFEAAALCELWLRTMPAEFPGRVEAGRVAVALAREVQGRRAEGVIFVGKADRVICEALLQASSEFPDEVSQLVLELCGRREEAESIMQRAKDAAEARSRTEQERQKRPTRKGQKRSSFPIGLPSSWGPIRVAGSDGPTRRVSEGLQSAVLDTVALNPLINVRPQIAREVLLAVCLDGPKRQSEYENERFSLPGFAYWPDGSPPMYWKGGFYRFLQLAPSDALDGVLRLVNFATERWLEKGLGHEPTEEERRAFSLEFEFRGEVVRWIGDGGVFAWSRFSSGIPEIVDCALMALEKWLYDLLEKGTPIEDWVDVILKKNSSLAIAGVLVAVGLKNPKLFTNVLQPLLGDWILYQWQLRMALEEQREFWRLSLTLWTGRGEKPFALARDWHAMPHRKLMLQDVAVNLMLFDEGTKQYFAERRKHWRMQLESMAKGTDEERLEFFLAHLDPNNYVLTDMGEEGIEVQSRFPAHLEERSRDARETGKLKMLMLQLPSAARRLLIENRQGETHNIEEFVRSLRRVAETEEPDQADVFLKNRRTEAIAGGIAVLVVLHREWLAKKPETEEWCLQTLKALTTIAPDESSSPMDALDTAAEGFIGQAAVALSLEGKKEWVVRAIAAGVTAHHYSSTFHVLTTAFRMRGRLGADFLGLQNLVILWSAVRQSSVYVFKAEDNEVILGRRREMLVQRYLRGKDGKAPISLARANRIGKRMLRRREGKNEGERGSWRSAGDDRRLYRESAGLDLEVLRQGFGFLAELAVVATEAERSELIARCRELLEFEFSMIPEIATGDVDVDVQGPLYEFDYWVFELIAKVMISGISLADAKRFWEPILELPVAAHDWVRAFLEIWFRVGLAGNMTNFEAIWSEMIRHMLDSQTWSPERKYGWYHIQDVIAELMGIRSAKILLGQARYISLIEAIAPLYERWTEQWIRRADLAMSFAYFLSTESGSILIPQGVKRIAAVLPLFSDFDWSRERLKDALSSMLRTCWKKYRDHVRSDQGFWKAFLTVLNALCARQDTVALEIQLDVARSSNS
jgi:hypothetical protein